MSRLLARVMSGTLEKNSSSLVGKIFLWGDAVVLDFSPGVCSCPLLISKKMYIFRRFYVSSSRKMVAKIVF